MCYHKARVARAARLASLRGPSGSSSAPLAVVAPVPVVVVVVLALRFFDNHHGGRDSCLGGAVFAAVGAPPTSHDSALVDAELARRCMCTCGAILPSRVCTKSRSTSASLPLLPLRPVLFGLPTLSFRARHHGGNWLFGTDITLLCRSPPCGPVVPGDHACLCVGEASGHRGQRCIPQLQPRSCPRPARF